MCGIVGIWDKKNEINKQVLERMNSSIAHRGPDDAGYCFGDNNKVAFAQRRLSIIDLTSAGHQPMEHNGSFITFNGEVYNYRDIRKKMEQNGEVFESQTDTEVVLKNCLKKGSSCLEDFRGMYAFAVWNSDKQQIFIARDRVGLKPLYYYHSHDLFIFSSELRAIIEHPGVPRELDYEALSLYLQMGFVPAPYAIFKKIHKLPPGYYLTLNKNFEISVNKYWDIGDYYSLQNNSISHNESLQNELENILTDSFKLRMVADVEVGMFLSGGVDSSLVAAILTKKLGYKNLKTFTIGFDEPGFNEAHHAKIIADYLGTDHHEFYCKAADAKELIKKLPDIFDEPFGDSSAIPTYLLSRFARNYVKVSLSADGGDEMFAGYDRYFSSMHTYRILKLFPHTLLRTLVTILNFLNFIPKKFRHKLNKAYDLFSLNKSPVSYYQTLGYGFWRFRAVKNLLLSSSNAINAVKFIENNISQRHIKILSKMQLMDFKNYLPDGILTKLDRATMAVALEGRDPLLDYKIAEFAATMPESIKYHNGKGKYVLKNILFKFVPKNFVDRPKQGFSIPLESWLKGDLRYLFDEYLSETFIKKQGIFNWYVVNQEVNLFISGQGSSAYHLWLLIVFQMWYKRWVMDLSKL